MRILLINWQDRENPQAGGAEIHLHEIFGRLAAGGDDVRLLCSGWRGCTPTATVDGIQVTRVGTRYTFPALVRGAYQALVQDWKPDVLVEDINKVPLFTPRWSGPRSGNPPVVALVPHLFGGTVFQEAPAPVAAAVWLAERPLPRAYANTPFQAISESTRDDLVARGIPAASIRVIYPGIDTQRYTPLEGSRAPVPTFAYLGRLKRYKGVDLVLRAFAQLDQPEARLLIAGGGDYRESLEALARSLDLTDRVQFLGFISESQKLELLRAAWSLVFASPKEGWGITNLEAAACCTPVIASNSPGLRESVRNGETGFLVPHGNVGELSSAMKRIASTPGLVSELGSRGRRFAETFTWARAAAETRDHLEIQVRGG